jgi:hypothetical protein
VVRPYRRIVRRGSVTGTRMHDGGKEYGSLRRDGTTRATTATRATRPDHWVRYGRCTTWGPCLWPPCLGPADCAANQQTQRARQIYLSSDVRPLARMGDETACDPSVNQSMTGGAGHVAPVQQWDWRGSLTRTVARNSSPGIPCQSDTFSGAAPKLPAPAASMSLGP